MKGNKYEQDFYTSIYSKTLLIFATLLLSPLFNHLAYSAVLIPTRIHESLPSFVGELA